MMKNFVSYILVMLIALQSILAVADAHVDHHSDSDVHPHVGHQVSDDKVVDSPKAPSINFSEQSAEPVDCHHSHCPHFHSLATTIPNFMLSVDETLFLGFISSTPLTRSFPLYRPPIV